VCCKRRFALSCWRFIFFLYPGFTFLGFLTNFHASFSTSVVTFFLNCGFLSRFVVILSPFFISEYVKVIHFFFHCSIDDAVFFVLRFLPYLISQYLKVRPSFSNCSIKAVSSSV